MPSSDIDLAPRPLAGGEVLPQRTAPQPVCESARGPAGRARPGGGARLLHEPPPRLGSDRPATAADLHLLLLAGRPGALLGLHPGASLGRRQRMGRFRQFHRHAVRPGLLELGRQQHCLCRRKHRPCHGGRPGAGTPHRPRVARLRASTDRCWSGRLPSPRRRWAWHSASSWRPRPASWPSSTSCGLACGIRRSTAPMP